MSYDEHSRVPKVTLNRIEDIGDDLQSQIRGFQAELQRLTTNFDDMQDPIMSSKITDLIHSLGIPDEYRDDESEETDGKPTQVLPPEDVSLPKQEYTLRYFLGSSNQTNSPFPFPLTPSIEEEIDYVTGKQKKLEQIYKANEVIYEEEESPERNSSSRNSFRYNRKMRIATEDGILPDSLDGTPINFQKIRDS